MTEPRILEDSACAEPLAATTVERRSGCPPLTVHSFGLTDRGRVRESNEDQFFVAVLLKALHIHQTSLPLPKVQHSHDRSYLFVVADGMGGRAAGETASALAVDSVGSFVLESLKWFAECRGAEQDQVLVDFQRALADASARVRAEGAAHSELHGMGTTLTLAYSLNDELFVAHAGDSRCYLCRHRHLVRLTRDHTLVDELVRRGGISAEEAKHHHWRHVISNALGGGCPEVKVEVHKLQLESGDIVLLCSDGLTEMLSDDKISEILDAETDPEKACRQLVARANEEGGRDNITVIVAHFSEARETKP
jgi:serine/threonine protein phosphatase PrpC